MRPATDAERQLHALAEEARANAHAPYSGFSVGAAIRFDDGAVVTAANVENASYGLTICAERSAVVAGIAQGHRRIDAVAVAGPAEDVSPCGACRQVLAEFSDPGTAVTFPYGGALVTATMAELLPAGFTL
jgi:cytidine deaminase